MKNSFIKLNTVEKYSYGRLFYNFIALKIIKQFNMNLNIAVETLQQRCIHRADDIKITQLIRTTTARTSSFRACSLLPSELVVFCHL